MPVHSNLCSACLGALRSGLEEVIDKSLRKTSKHHANFVDFRDAVTNKCYICAKLWDSISDEAQAEWLKDPVNWQPFSCWLERRPWAPEQYGSLYWHLVYLVFNHPGPAGLKYAGDVFCLFPGNKEAGSGSEAGTAVDTDPDFQTSTSSAKVHQQAYGWYKTCRDSHEICRKLGSQHGFVPARLIDVGIEGDDCWKLCRYPEDIHDPTDYLALSYRWAQNPTIKLLESTIDDFRRGAAIDSLPQTFRDAITVARRFSIRYLWIDSLCIIQDSPGDWARESVRMHMVYSNSACNIAAAASDDPDGGLFRLREPSDVEYGCINIDFPSGASRSFDLWDQYYMNRITRGPLTGRGWVFQERVLSPRVLHFTQTQIVWECFEMKKCEMFPILAPGASEASFVRELKMVHPFFSSGSWNALARVEPHKKMSVEAYEQWSHLVREYSKCTLTCGDDRLIAMSGIAEMYKKYTGDEYLAGLWRSRLVEGLNWVVTSPVSQPPNNHRVPSWSWAAVDSAVVLTSVSLPRDDDLVEIISAEAEIPMTAAAWRHIRGLITLRGCLSKATVKACGTWDPKGENVMIELEGFPSRFFAYPDTTATTFEAGMTLHLLPLRSTLRRMTDKNGDEVEKNFGTLIVIIEGIIMELVSVADASYRRTGHFVVDSTEHAASLGLVATPPWPDARCDRVTMDGSKVSVISLI